MHGAANASQTLKVDITIMQAIRLPNLKKTTGKENRKFYVTIANANAKKEIKKTNAICSEGNAVKWNEKLVGLTVPQSSQIAVSLYAKHTIRSDDLIGTINIDPISITEASFDIATTSAPGAPSPTIVITLYVHGNQSPSQHSNVLAKLPKEEHNPMSDTHVKLAVDQAQVISPTAIDGVESTTPSSHRWMQETLEENMRMAVETSYTADNAIMNMHVLDEWTGTIRNIEWLVGMVENVADIHPVAKLAWNIISPIPKAFLLQVEIDEHVQDLVKAMRSAVELTSHKDLIQVIKPNSNQAFILKVMLAHITACGEAVQCYASDEEFRKRFLANITGRMSDKISELCKALANLRQDFLQNASVDTQITVHDIQKSMELLLNETSDFFIDNKLADLPYNSGWSSTANKNRCLEGTRTDFIEYITQWIQDPSSKRGFILYGQLGTGKSSIAFEIASRFYFECSYFCFSRAKKTIQDHHLVTTIIRDIADRHPLFKREVGRLISNNTPLRTSDDINQLFTTLLLGPLNKAGNTIVPIVIVIDALDESKNPKQLAQFLSRAVQELPPNINVFITSRSEEWMDKWFPATVPGGRFLSYEIRQMNDGHLASKTQDDICLYFQTHLPTDIFDLYGEKLVKKAEGLFQWASVACGYLNDLPPGVTTQKCLQLLLSGDAHELQSEKLYKLYIEVLSGHFALEIARPLFRSVMSQLLGAFEPLSINTLANLRQFTGCDDHGMDSVLAVLKFMGSLLSNIAPGKRDLSVVPLHTSLRDFLVDKTHKHPFFLDLAAAHKELTYACFDLMLHPSGLKFNICKLESSYFRNTEVDDLQSRIHEFISPSLLYSCRFWGDHLECIPFDEAIFYKLEHFFSTKFLFWLEVLSVNNLVTLAGRAMATTMKWLQSGLFISESNVTSKMKALIGVITDALTFLRYFGTVIATSAPHIYVSALPFAPTSSNIYQTYSCKYPATLSFKQGQLNHWPELEKIIPAASEALCVQFSPDGQWIVCGMNNGIICLWNATTGMLEGNPFIKHTGGVLSIAFSPDGQHIVSGSADFTICLWSVATGAIEGSPWTGHRNEVNSVVFSPNGQHVVSGSDDTTIQIWDVAKRSINGSPITEHDDAVSSVAFSLDGDKMVSGSMDSTIRVWSFRVANEMVEVTPLLSLSSDPSSWMCCVSISPNGNQIAAGHYGGNIYMWDNLSGQAERFCLPGHALRVFSVTFSPDGRRLVSGSEDCRLFLWDTEKKTIQGNPLNGHTWAVRSLAFSSDGQRIASASIDHKIGLWNATSVEHTAEGGTNAVTRRDSMVDSVAFSPIQGSHLIATGADDGIICLRNVETGNTIGNPLQGHTGPVFAIAFSPNGRLLATGSTDGTLRLWNVDKETMGANGCIQHSTLVYAVAFSPDGQQIVSGSGDGKVQVWNTETREMEGIPLTKHYPSRVLSVGFSPNGRHIVSASLDGAVWLWDISEKETPKASRLADISNTPTYFVAFLDSQTIISCSEDSIVRKWYVSAGEIIRTASFTLGNDGDTMTSFSLSPDKSRLAAGCNDFTIGVWNLATFTREDLVPMVGHTAWVRPHSLAFSTDGQQLVSGSYDSTIRVWDVSVDRVNGPEPPPGIDFFNLNDEGWVYGEEKGLVLWIPQVHRSTYRRPSNIITIIASHQTSIDFSNFVHGKDWTAPYVHTS